MAENPNESLFGLSPTKYGMASLVTACLVNLSQTFVVVAGVFLVLLALVPLSLISAVTGLLGVGTGLYYKDWTGMVTGAVGIALTGWVVWSLIWNVMHF